MSAYACIPGRGSEPGVGWNMALEMAKRHQVWVITRTNNRPAIESELSRNPIAHLHFVYHDLPKWTLWFKRGQSGTHLYYYFWQIGAYLLAKKLHQQVLFDLGHHVTFVKYWAPSLLALLPFPYVWGPVGGGESAPKSFWKGFGIKGVAFEGLREVAQRLAELDPWVRLTARRASITLVTTEETAQRVRALGAKKVQLLSQVALPDHELHLLASLPSPAAKPFRFVSMGNLLHLKGTYLGLEAFAKSGLGDAEFWVIGDGPERGRLEQLAQDLGIAERVKFWGQLPRPEALRKLAQCHVLVHPTLHDSGGFVCIEAMAAGKPVVCLNLGGPAVQVIEGTGYKVTASSPAASVEELSVAMGKLARQPQWYQQLSQNAREYAAKACSWANRARTIEQCYSRG